MLDVINLNPESDRYRVCPECTLKFMTNHLSRDFCSKKCANSYNNKKKRNDAHANKVINGPDVIISPIVSTENLIKPTPLLNISKTLSEQSDNEELKLKKAKNIKILAELLLDKSEATIKWQYLIEIGFDIRLYDSTEGLPSCNLRKANYGNFSIVWTTATHILLTHQIHLLWTSQ